MEFQSTTITIITFKFFKPTTITITFQFAPIYYFSITSNTGYFVYKSRRVYGHVCFFFFLKVWPDNLKQARLTAVVTIEISTKIPGTGPLSEY